MYVLNTHLLQLGDIILSRSSNGLSVLVRRQSNSSYSHAALVVAEHSCIESRSDGVHSENIQRLGFERADDVLVLRLKKQVAMAALDTVMNYARSKVGTTYASRAEVTRSYANQAAIAQEQNRQYCTRLVTQAYSAAGIALVANTDYCTPGDIEHSAELKVISNCLCLASEEQEKLVKEADEGNTVLATQAEVTAHFLLNVRQLTGKDIQTLAQVDDYIASDQTYDKLIANLLAASGYLSLGDMDKAQNPWFYDSTEFEKQWNEQDRQEIAVMQQGPEAVRLHSFKKEYERYEKLADALQSDYFRVIANCVLRQCELSGERNKVWTSTIDSYLPF